MELVIKNPSVSSGNMGDMGSIPGSEKYSCVENSMDGGAWLTVVHGFTELESTELLVRQTDTQVL